MEIFMKRSGIYIVLLVSLVACTPLPVPPTNIPTPVPSSTFTPAPILPTITLTPIPSSTLFTTPKPLIPNFEHIAIIMFENKEFGTVIGNSLMPNYNRLAREYTLLTQHYAVRHPSLPNYVALISGDTFGIDRNCHDCFIDAPSLPDLIEASGRTWKTYQEDMPEPCYLGDTDVYVQKHNPFIYFNSIRLDAARCERTIVPLTALQMDMETASLPNFIFITPNLCNDAHDCPLDVADAWLTELLGRLVPALDTTGKSYLLVMMFEEGQGTHSCCGLPVEAGGACQLSFIPRWLKTDLKTPRLTLIIPC